LLVWHAGGLITKASEFFLKVKLNSNPDDHNNWRILYEFFEDRGIVIYSPAYFGGYIYSYAINNNTGIDLLNTGKKTRSSRQESEEAAWAAAFNMLEKNLTEGKL